MVNWTKSLGQPVGVISSYANLQALQTLPQSAITASAATTTQAGPGGTDRATTVTVTNTSVSTVAFLLRADVRRGTAGGQELPGDSELQSSISVNQSFIRVYERNDSELDLHDEVNRAPAQARV